MIQYLLQSINTNNTFQEKLHSLFNKYPLIDKNALGFTNGWENEPMWIKKSKEKIKKKGFRYYVKN